MMSAQRYVVFVIHEVVLHLHCRPKVKYLLSLIVIVLTGRGPRSLGSIEFLFLIWTGYFNLGSSWLSAVKDRKVNNYIGKSTTNSKCALYIKVKKSSSVKVYIKFTLPPPDVTKRPTPTTAPHFLITRLKSECFFLIPKQQCASSPRWWSCCCGRWRKAVRLELFSSPILGAGSSAGSCVATLGSCKGTAGETED